MTDGSVVTGSATTGSAASGGAVSVRRRAGREDPGAREGELLIAGIDELTPEDRRHVAALVESLRKRGRNT
jgi:hypothetical protein